MIQRKTGRRTESHRVSRISSQRHGSVMAVPRLGGPVRKSVMPESSPGGDRLQDAAKRFSEDLCPFLEVLYYRITGKIRV